METIEQRLKALPQECKQKTPAPVTFREPVSFWIQRSN
jgi:hypothetical protein